MSPQLQYEMARSTQQQIAGAIHAHRVAAADRPGRSVRLRVSHAAAALGACLALTTTLAVTGAHGSSPTPHASGHISAAQLGPGIRAYEAKGYKPIACTRQGTLMENFHTHRLVNVKW